MQTPTPTTAAIRDEAYALLAEAEAIALDIRQTRASEDAGSPEAARIAVLFEQAEWACRRSIDRCRHDPVLAHAFLQSASQSLNLLREEAAPPLTPEEEASAWNEAQAMVADESTRDRARVLMAEWGKIGAREVLADMDQLAQDEASEAMVFGEG